MQPCLFDQHVISLVARCRRYERAACAVRHPRRPDRSTHQHFMTCLLAPPLAFLCATSSCQSLCSCRLGQHPFSHLLLAFVCLVLIYAIMSSCSMSSCSMPA